MPRSIELFAGCGGLALGMSRAGFTHDLLVEWNQDAFATIEHNRERGLDHVANWPARCLDVRDVRWTAHRDAVRVLTGGPPCQPFGIGGKKRGHEDVRDMWPEAVRAVREVLPDAFVFENVRNLAGPRFAAYLDWVKECLRHPNHPRRDGETHAEHAARLRELVEPAIYVVDHEVVNAADFGAPQVRHRVLIRGVRASLRVTPPSFQPTHSRRRLLWDQWRTGAYWRRHGLPIPVIEQRPRDIQALALQMHGELVPPPGLPWVTLRDAIVGLGEPDGCRNHVPQPGARSYAGHTGSPLDLPAKALKAGDHGVPGGENMIRFDDGSVRYLTTREAARLVGLPDDYLFPRSWTEAMRQLGNAVPAQLGEAIGRWLANTLDETDVAPARHRRRA